MDLLTDLGIIAITVGIFLILGVLLMKVIAWKS